MSWFWRSEPVLDAAAADELGLTEPFGSQADAEAWVGVHYPELAEAGVRAVALYEEDRLVYGPMSLAAE